MIPIDEDITRFGGFVETEPRGTLIETLGDLGPTPTLTRLNPSTGVLDKDLRAALDGPCGYSPHGAVAHVVKLGIRMLCACRVDE